MHSSDNDEDAIKTFARQHVPKDYGQLIEYMKKENVDNLIRMGFLRKLERGLVVTNQKRSYPRLYREETAEKSS